MKRPMLPGASDSTPIESASQLDALFRDACKPRARWRVGAEAEKCAVYAADGKPVPYAGPRGILAVLERLAADYGWQPVREREGGPIIALSRDQTNITLEPGGQLELSGAPRVAVHETCTEFRGHLKEIAAISGELGIAWLALGFHPFAKRDELEWVPKARYGIMREYLPSRGEMAHDMMQRTCALQVNLDYASEDDAVRKMRAALAVSPIATAMFANSPVVEGRASGERSWRSLVWMHTDPDRSGLLPFVFEEPFGFRRYIEWALDVPMFLVQRGERTVPATKLTFRRYMKEGLEGERATLGDWEQHLNTLFPEVRLKRTIEARGADNVPMRLVCAVPALWKGVLYDDAATEAAWALTRDLRAEEREDLRRNVARAALGATVRGRKVHDLARELCAIAADGLRRQHALSKEGHDESIHLQPLRELLDAGKCPADYVLEAWDPASPTAVTDLIEKTRY